MQWSWSWWNKMASATNQMLKHFSGKFSVWYFLSHLENHLSGVIFVCLSRVSSPSDQNKDNNIIICLFSAEPVAKTVWLVSGASAWIYSGMLFLCYRASTWRYSGMIFLCYVTDFSYIPLKIDFRKLLNTVTVKILPFWKGV